jgi:type IV pilus assembly protein PilA
MYNDIRKNENKGFSLVELIVVIAIMAVMTAVLAPSLLQYVEKSRKQKDDSAMGELVQVVKLALAEQDVYDELLCYTAATNNSHYSKPGDEKRGGLCACADDKCAELASANACEAAAKTDAKHFRGVTITFESALNNNGQEFVLAAGKVNKECPSTEMYNGAILGGMTLGTMSSAADVANSTADNQLYTRVLAGIGEKIKITSQTYRNSNYTIFIEMGAADEAVVVHGEWDGTNLHTA